MYGVDNFNLTFSALGAGKHVYFQVLTHKGQRTIIRCNPDTSSAKVVYDLPEGVQQLEVRDETPPPPPPTETPKPKKSCNCKNKKVAPPPKTSLVEKAKGAVKLAKAELGVDDVSLDVLQARREACSSCEHNDFGRCSDCGCYLWAKTKLKSEKCPIGKW